VRARWNQISSYGQDRLSTPEERRVAGRIGGALWLAGGITLAFMLALPGGPIGEMWLVALILAFSIGWGAASVALVPWERVPPRFFHVSGALGLVFVAAFEGVTGGEESPAHEYLWFAIVFAAFFFTAGPALAYWVACCAVSALPLLVRGGQAVEDNLLRELLIVVPTFAIVGGVVFVARERLSRLSREARALGEEQERLAAEQASLRRVATAVAAGSPAQAIFSLVSSEAGRLLGADAAGITRYLSAERLEIMGVWQGRTEPGEVLELDPDDELARVRAAGAPIRIDRYDPGQPSRAQAFGYGSLVVAPIYAGNTIWGALTAASSRQAWFAPGAEGRLSDYADLIATAVTNAEARSRLDAQAGVDPLTELPNHRAFRDRVEDEVSRARRHDRPLTVAVIDVDRFRDLIERVGHEAAEQTLVDIAARLRAAVRDEDVVARLGADEFGIAFVEIDRATALLAVERARRLIASAPMRHGAGVTVSAGMCDLEAAPSADELLRRADAAVFWSKQHGRDRSWIYDPSVVSDLAAHVRRRALDEEQGMAGLRALARAIDAKDPATQEHSERVADLAARLAAERAWGPECIDRLREAATLHDVGKIGVPDAVLLKPAPLDESEMALMRQHAALGARIVGDVLDDEQVGWIGAHHERPDGQGYPSGLTAAQISEGAALLALADAWDSMISHRVYSPVRAVDDAIEECRGLAGRQFTFEAIEALEALHARGGLAMAAARVHRPTPDDAEGSRA
jgi:diguanylate cyclase (GGDEF)-like protein